MAKRFEYFIVALTKNNKLVSGYVMGESIADAMDVFIDQHDLQAQIVEYKFCLRREKFTSR